MEKLATPLKFILLTSIFLLIDSMHAQDFKVQHIQADVDETGTIVNSSSTIDAVSSLNSAFVIPGNNKMTHAGRSDSNNSELEGDDMAGARVLTDTDEITYYRESASDSDAQGMNFQTMIWEYLGPVSGPNEFIVRGRYQIVLNATDSGAIPTDISIPTNEDSLSEVQNADNCIPFITGILNNDDASGADSGTAIAYLSDSSTLQVKKGTTSNNVTVFITLVEFTGANWTVLHGTSGGNSNNSGSITLTAESLGSGTNTSVGNWSNSLIIGQSKAQTKSTGGARDHVNSQWPLLYPGSDNQSVDWEFDSGRTVNNNNKSNHFVHVLENAEMGVTRFDDYSNNDNGTTIDVSSAYLTSLELSMVLGTSISSNLTADDADRSYAGGWRNYYFNSISQIEHWSHRSGNTMKHNIQVVNFDPPLTQSSGPGGVIESVGLWLKADYGAGDLNEDPAEDGTPIANWTDNTINANNIVPSAAINQPTFNEFGINFNPSISFDGTNHELTTSIEASSQYTIFAIAEGTYGSTKTLLNLDNGANGSIKFEQTGSTELSGSYTDSSSSTSGEVTNDLTLLTEDVPQLLSFRHLAGEKNRMFVNGVLQTLPLSNTNANTLSGTLTVGIGANPSTSSTRWNGEVAELVIFNYKVPQQERWQIESYFALKYGLTLGVNGTSQDYYDSKGNVIWNIVDNDGFNHDIAGVGEDQDSELLQKQSKSINSENDITIGIKQIADSNIENTTDFFTDRSFLIWGNDDGSTSTTRTISKDFGGGTGEIASLSATAVNRSWKLNVTDSVPTVKLSIPKSMVSSSNPGDANKYIMIVADDESFTTNVTSATMDISGDDLEVDFYFENTKYITFGAAPIVSLGNRSLSFDNYGPKDTYLDAGDVNDLDNTDFTISAWVRRDVGADKFDIVSKRNYFGEVINPLDYNDITEGGYSHGYAFRINQHGQFRMVWRNPGDSQNNQLQTYESIPENEWHHIAATYDISENKAVLYIDGIHVYDEEDYFVDKGVLLGPLTIPSDSHFMIGAAHHIKRQQKVRGSIDEVRVWNVALDPEQIRYIMNQEIEQNGSFADGKILPSATSKNEIVSIPWNNLIGYYPMSNAVFGSIKDESNSGNDMSMINYNNLDAQTAPLPYKTKQNGAWDSSDTWENGDVQYLPGVVSYLFESEADADKMTLDYNIVEIDHEITLENSDENLIPLYKEDNRTTLGLTVNAGGKLIVDGDTATNAGNGITITHYLKIDGEIDLEGESQLIQTDRSDLDPLSSGTLERDQQGTKDFYTYNYWSSPVGL